MRGVSGPVLAVAHTPSDMSEAQAEQAQIDIANAIKAKGGNNVKPLFLAVRLKTVPADFPGDPHPRA